MLAWFAVLLAVVAVHGFTIWWTRRRYLELRETVLLHIPFPPAYLAALAWWHMGDWPAWWIAWGLAVLDALAWVVLWLLQRPTDPRRAIATLAAVLVLVGGSGFAVAAIVWEETNGFGWKGEATPWGALAALTAASCHAESGYYINRHETRQAECPRLPNVYNGKYDTQLFDRLSCSDQPRKAFQRFWDWNQDYQLLFSLKVDIETTVVDRIPTLTPYPPDIEGERATIVAEMRVLTASHISEDDQEWFMRVQPGGGKETWNVSLEWAVAGGWKICRIDIEEPIEPTFEPAR